jgi:hypothetical protein
MLVVPALDRVALAVLFFGAVLGRDKLRAQRDDIGMPGRHDGRRQQSVIVLELAVGAFARQTMRATKLLRTEILGPIPGYERSIAEPAKNLAPWRLGEPSLQANKAGRQPRGIGRVEPVADVIV